LYSIVKSVIDQLSKIWNSEYNKYGVTSKIISPSFMRTNLTSNLDERIIEMFYENDSNHDEINSTSNNIVKLLENYYD
jgi:NAD(P)-dependent dehydrogenase (short-subunit alcohol dehydrogenase family)